MAGKSSTTIPVDPFVHSRIAQAALTMPIMAEYINPVLPTSGMTMGVLGLARLKWEKWVKWILPLLILWVLFGFITLIPRF